MINILLFIHRSGRWKCGILFLVAGTIFLHASREASSQEGLRSLRSMVVQGKYEKSLQEADKLLENQPANDRASALKARVLRLTGKYEKGRKLLESVVERENFNGSNHVRLELARIYLIEGKYNRSLDQIQRVFSSAPNSMRARWLRVQVFREIGKYDSLENELQYFWKKRKRRNLNARELYYLARGLWMYARWMGEENGFRLVTAKVLPAALKKRERFPEARTFWAYCFRSKNQFNDAYEELKKVRSYNSNHPFTLTELAQIFREEGRKKRAKTLIKKAVKVNSHYLPLLRVQARRALVWRDYKTARKVIDRALSVNEDAPLFLSYRAAFYYLRDHFDQYKEVKKKVLSVNSRYGNLFFIVGDLLSQRYRFQEAQKLFHKARNRNPRLNKTLREQGINYLRLGEGQKGTDLLERYYQRNSFDEKAVNKLNLFDDLLGDTFRTVSFPGYRLRMRRGEIDVARPIVRNLLERVDRTMQKRYDLSREDTILLELYQKHDRFSVRTLGMTGFLAHGVCFGNVTAALSPRARKEMEPFNWGSIVWHEMAHAYALRLSNHRVPRWFTEGLSTYEEKFGRQEWGRELERKIYYAWKKGALPSIQELVEGNKKSVLSLYLYGSIIMEYLDQTYGFDRIVEMLRLYGEGKETGEIFEAVIDRSISEFQKEFRKYFRNRFESYRFRGYSTGKPGKKKVRKQRDQDSEKDGNDDRMLIRKAKKLLEAEKFQHAKSIAERLKKSEKYRGPAQMLLGDIAYKQRLWSSAVPRYRKAIEEGVNDYRTFVRAGWSNEQIEDLNTASSMYEKAIEAFDRPKYSARNPYIRLHSVYREMGKKSKAIARLKTFTDYGHIEVEPHMKLAEHYLRKENWDQFMDTLQSLLYIDYWNVKIHSYRGKGFEEQKNFEKAHRAYRTVVKILLREIKEEPGQKQKTKLSGFRSNIARFLYKSARMSRKMGNYGKAKKEVQTAIRSVQEKRRRKEYRKFLEKMKDEERN